MESAAQHLALVHAPPFSSSVAQERLPFDLQLELSAVPLWINPTDTRVAVVTLLSICVFT